MNRRGFMGLGALFGLSAVTGIPMPSAAEPARLATKAAQVSLLGNGSPVIDGSRIVTGSIRAAKLVIERPAMLVSHDGYIEIIPGHYHAA